MQKRKKTNSGISWKILLSCLLTVAFMAIIGNSFSGGAQTSSWYDSIRPAITPPGYVFPIVWSILYLMIAVALYFSWKSAGRADKRAVALTYGINLLANALWTLFFFGMKNPALAMADIVIIWFSILAMMQVSKKIDKRAFYLLVPYLLWVSFASILNYLAI
jgi:translocator protein